jgi:small subunit ribosomal protein S6
MFIIKPELDEEQVTTATDRVHQLIVANDGNVTKTAAWGKRRLAYSVGQYHEGYYVVSNFEVDSAKIAELERVLKISDTVFRHLLVKRDAPAIGQTEVVVPEATPEELAAMYEPVVTEEETDEAPPAVTEDEEELVAVAAPTDGEEAANAVAANGEEEPAPSADSQQEEAGHEPK